MRRQLHFGGKARPADKVALLYWPDEVWLFDLATKDVVGKLPAEAYHAVAFSPDGQYLFLTSGDRQRMTPAQDPDQAMGKILRLTLDGKPVGSWGREGRKQGQLFNPWALVLDSQGRCHVLDSMNHRVQRIVI